MINRLCLIAVFCFSQTLIFPSYADDSTVFGFTLGQDFSLPECEKVSDIYIPTTSYVCFERILNRENTGPITSATVRIKLPIAEIPSIMGGSGLLARVIDGRLESIGFNTKGIRTSETVLSKLKEKYGEPDMFMPRTVKNRLGASFETFDAGWNRQNIQVIFKGVTDSLDSGLVAIDTAKNREGNPPIFSLI